jgi:hypothetical protein
MIYQIYTVLLLSCFALLFYGWWVSSDMFRIFGVTLLFLLGMALSPTMPSVLGTVDYSTGATILTNGSIMTVSNTYATYQNHTLSFYMMITAIVGLIILMIDRRKG